MLSLLDLTQPLTPDQVRVTIYNILSKVGITTTNWKPGAVVRTIIAFVAVLFSSFSYWSAEAVKGGFLLLARGDWLTANAKYDYGTERNPASFAAGTVTLQNSGAGVYDIDPGELTLQYTNTSDGVVYNYSNTNTVHIDGGTPSVPAEASLAITAEIIGTKPNIPATATLTLQPPTTGLSILVTTAILGSDEETDQQLINRAMASASADSPNGPKEAYQYWATTLKNSDGNPIADKVSIVAGIPVQVYVANNSGSISSDDLSTLDTVIQTKVVPLGVNVTVSQATGVDLVITYTAYATTNTTLSAADIEGYIQDSLETFFANLPIGGYPATDDSGHTPGTYWIYNDSIKSAIENSIVGVPGVVNPIFHATVSVAGWASNDIPLSTSQVARSAGTTPSVVLQ